MYKPQVLMPCGAVSGVGIGRVESFLGVPYAKPPTGGLRFQKTQPVFQWAGYWNSENYAPRAPQAVKPKELWAEDCLTLNIWKPTGDPAEKLPVMFFIHGGSFSSGSASDAEFNGARLAKAEQVVVVTVNYRLGVLGFMDFSFLGEGFDANCGLHDIIEALRFVHNNIGHFGGDRNRLIVIGQSAGATAASILACIPEANRYMAGAILMSAGPTHLHTQDFAQDIARQYMDFIGAKTANDLRNMDVGKLALRHIEFTKACGLGAGTFMPVVDGNLVHKYPIQSAQAGALKSVPLLIGTTREELSPYFIKPFAKVLDIESIMRFGVDQESEAVKDSVSATYERYGEKARIIRLSDMVFRIASLWYAEASQNHTNVWLYRFDYTTPLARLFKLYAFHSSDLPFFFGNFDAGLAKFMTLSTSRRELRHLHKEMRSDFCSFARTGRLPWKPVSGTDTTGKCYRSVPVLGPVTEPDTMAAYACTKYRQRCFHGDRPLAVSANISATEAIGRNLPVGEIV